MTGPDPYVPAGPVEQSPVAFRPAERREALGHVLRGVQLGDWDRQIIDWLLNWDDSTIRTICSLIERARQAEYVIRHGLLLALAVIAAVAVAHGLGRHQGRAGARKAATRRLEDARQVAEPEDAAGRSLDEIVASYTTIQRRYSGGPQ